MTESRRLLQHFLAALAYRTQKAVRGAPPAYADFRAGPAVRTPHELVWHMTGVIGYARTMLRDDLADPALAAAIRDEQFLQGPLADAMTHAGQLAMLRRLTGDPVPPEDFIFARIDAANVGAEQAEPVRPDPGWSPEQIPQPPGPGPAA